MARLITLALLLIAGGSCYASQRIVGGANAVIETYPSIIQIEFQGIASGTWSQNCGGTILNNIYILSAAQCFDGVFYEPAVRRIRAGSATRNSGGIIMGVQQAFNHPAYGVAARFDADISVVRLSGFLTFTPTIQQGQIPSSDSIIADNQVVVKAGWGNTEDGGSPATELQDALVFTVNRDVCSQAYADLPIPSVVTENMFCAGFLGLGGRDSCRGDAGGPVYIGNIVVGVISWGSECGNPEYPGVSTNVVPFSEWIVQVTLQG